MKKVYLTLFCLILLTGGAALCPAQSVEATPAQSLAVRPDKIVGQAKVFYSKEVEEVEVQTSLSLYDERKDGKLDAMGLGASYRVLGRKIVAPQRVWLEFSTNTYELKFATPEGRRLTIIVDARDIDGAEMRKIETFKTPQGSSIEIVALSIDFETFKLMAKGSKVRLRVGQREFDLKDAQVDAFRDMLKVIER
jgi:hypothetical protein